MLRRRAHRLCAAPYSWNSSRGVPASLQAGATALVAHRSTHGLISIFHSIHARSDSYEASARGEDKDNEGVNHEEEEEEEKDEEDSSIIEARLLKNREADSTQRSAAAKGSGQLRPGLYVVATPIGNLSDITLRALHVLKSSSLICCEDTRTTRMMLKRYKIVGEERDRREGRVELMSYHQHSSPSKVNTIIQILKTGAHIVSLVSDAGTPSISDPGVPLITEAHRQNVPVIPVPGACAVVAALSGSGFPSERFIFEGFLPHERSKRKKLLALLAKQERTVAFYESPHRIVHTLADCVEVWGPEQEAYLARELTKLHEQTMRGSLSKLLETITQQGGRGEFTVLIGPRPTTAGDKRRGSRARRPQDFSDMALDDDDVDD